MNIGIDSSTINNVHRTIYYIWSLLEDFIHITCFLIFTTVEDDSHSSQGKGEAEKSQCAQGHAAGGRQAELS